MSTATRTQDVSAVKADHRVGDYDWPLLARHLDAHGWRSCRNSSRRASARG